MRIGINASPDELTTTLNTFPGTATCRVFGGPGKGIPSWGGTAITQLAAHGVIPWVSFKDWTSDTAATAAVNGWLTKIPGDIGEVWLTYHHEPEGDLNPGEYRRRWATLARTVRAHKSSNRVKLVPIHTLYPSRHKIWDRYRTDWTQWTGIWQQWAPTTASGAYVGDYMGWDCYQEITAAGYEDPGVFFRHPIGAAHTVGVPLVIPELGAVRTADDPTGLGRAGWINDCLRHLAGYDVQAVNWWQSTGTNGRDYRLDDAGTVAWSNAIAWFNGT